MRIRTAKARNGIRQPQVKNAWGLRTAAATNQDGRQKVPTLPPA